MLNEEEKNYRSEERLATNDERTTPSCRNKTTKNYCKDETQHTEANIKIDLILIQIKNRFIFSSRASFSWSFNSIQLDLFICLLLIWTLDRAF